MRSSQCSTDPSFGTEGVRFIERAHDTERTAILVRAPIGVFLVSRSVERCGLHPRATGRRTVGPDDGDHVSRHGGPAW